MKWAAVDRYSDGNGIIVDDTKNEQIDKPRYLAKTMVANNIVYHNGGSGIHGYNSENVYLINNTAYMNSRSPYLEYVNIGLVSCNNSMMLNNIVYAGPGDKVNSNHANNNVISDYNIYFGGLAPDLVGQNDRILNPRFVNPGKADFRLKKDSPAIDRGTTIFAPAFDIKGNPRPKGKAIDIGAHEF